MIIDRPNNNQKEITQIKYIQIMEKLIYLGTLLTNKRRNTEEITRRSGMTKSANKNFAKPQHTNKH